MAKIKTGKDFIENESVDLTLKISNFLLNKNIEVKIVTETAKIVSNHYDRYEYIRKKGVRKNAKTRSK